ncbi:pol polyprotein [Nephila pilipes]|uniref:Pol polyprotein n=1 Tax=Nephila pilipes TaxID=299642 RepID=A0A8X6QFN1_NEPPI|nr:pol polyprotein [Nephila pilipes]
MPKTFKRKRICKPSIYATATPSPIDVINISTPKIPEHSRRSYKVPVFGSSCDIFYDSSTKKKRPYIPESFRKIVFNSVHNLAHPGIKATTKLLKSKFVWPSINKDARTWTRSCLKCQKSKVTRHVQSPFQQYHNVSKRFTEINLDIIGPLPSS